MTDANRRFNIASTAVCTGLVILGGYVVATTPMTIGRHWGGLTAILAALGVTFLAGAPMNWIAQRYDLDKPHRSPTTWRVRRRWYGPHRPITVDGRSAVAVDWTDEGQYGSRTWVLVLSWTDTPADTRVEWRPLHDVHPNHP